LIDNNFIISDRKLTSLGPWYGRALAALSADEVIAAETRDPPSRNPDERMSSARWVTTRM